MFRCEDYPCCGHDESGPYSCLRSLAGLVAEIELEILVTDEGLAPLNLRDES